jgi:hypothetical protein
MRHDDMEIRSESSRGDGVRPTTTAPRDASLGELFKQLSNDTGELIRQEAALAKTELRDVGSTLARDGAKLGVAAGLGLIGALALATFAIIALGDLFGDSYWLSALLVGLVAVGVAVMLGRNATRDIKERGLKPQQTIATLREDSEWASQQARELKHDLTTNPTTPPTRR